MFSPRQEKLEWLGIYPFYGISVYAITEKAKIISRSIGFRKMSLSPHLCV